MTLVILTSILILVIIAAGLVFAYGRLPFFTQNLNATTTLSVATSTDPIAWKTIDLTKALQQKKMPSPYANAPGNYYYNFYDAGTFTNGPLTGSKLELGISTYTSVSGESDSYYGPYVYLVTDASGTPMGWWRDEDTDYPTELGLASVPVLDKSTFPAKLLSYHAVDQTLVRSTPDGPITARANVTFSKSDMQLQAVPGFEFDGDPILRSPSKGQTGVFSDIHPYDYFVQLPIGILFPASLTPNFMSDEGAAPQLIWSTGSTTVAAYNYDQYAYGLADCYDSLGNFAAIQQAFVQTGTTNKGDPVYELNPAGHDSVYQCLYAKTQRYNYDPATGNSTSYYPTTYTDFLGTHPVFFWKNATNDWVIFGRTDVVPAAEKAKPVIYLYPQRTETVQVRVNPVGGFTKTDPVYGDGWNVQATKDSLLTNLSDGKTYPYLFWEGGAEGIVNTPTEGFVVARADIPTLLADKLALLGLNSQERTDFMDFWVPRLTKAPYYFITFVPEAEMDRVAPLTIIPKPNTVIRVLIDYKPLSSPVSVQPLTITTPTRTGFTVVEWGGVVRD